MTTETNITTSTPPPRNPGSGFLPPPAVVEKLKSLVTQKKEEQEARERALHAPKVPYRREEPRVGRNDLCPCGSGKKYKKCHMLSDEAS